MNSFIGCGIWVEQMWFHGERAEEIWRGRRGKMNSAKWAALFQQERSRCKCEKSVAALPLVNVWMLGAHQYGLLIPIFHLYSCRWGGWEWVGMSGTLGRARSFWLFSQHSNAASPVVWKNCNPVHFCAVIPVCQGNSWAPSKGRSQITFLEWCTGTTNVFQLLHCIFSLPHFYSCVCLCCSEGWVFPQWL